MKPGTEVIFTYAFNWGCVEVRGTVLEPSEFTRAGEVRVQWHDAYGVTNVSKHRVTEAHSAKG